MNTGILPSSYKSQSYSHPKKFFLYKNQGADSPGKSKQENGGISSTKHMSPRSSEIDSDSMEICFQAVCQAIGNFDANAPSPKSAFCDSNWSNTCTYESDKSSFSNFQFSPLIDSMNSSNLGWTANCGLGSPKNDTNQAPKYDTSYLEQKQTDSMANLGYYSCGPVNSSAVSSSLHTETCSNQVFNQNSFSKDKSESQRLPSSYNLNVIDKQISSSSENRGEVINLTSDQKRDDDSNFNSNSAAPGNKINEIVFNKNSLFFTKYGIGMNCNSLKEEGSNSGKNGHSSLLSTKHSGMNTDKELLSENRTVLSSALRQNKGPKLVQSSNAFDSVTSSTVVRELSKKNDFPSSDNDIIMRDKWLQPDSTANRKLKCTSKKERRWSLGSQNQCQVCGDKAAGFYCGAFVCEACKKFFMRACKQGKVKYLCVKEQKCVITKESRVQCQYCRYQKCLALKMHSPGASEGKDDSDIAEIPCRVCLAPSSGFHFGALTCEGCKGFFRRMAKERETKQYQCSKDSKCEINSVTRNLCKSCRYKKCIDVGMSIDACRIGRQPNSVKHAINLELKQRGQDIGANGLDFKSLNDPSLDFTGTSTSTMKIDDLNSEEITIKVEPEEMEDTISDKNTAAKQMENAFPAAGLDYENFIKCYELAGNDLRALKNRTPNSQPANNPANFTDHITTWTFMMIEFEWHTACVVKFAKKLHGFRSLTLEDQVRLVQSAIYPLVILNLSRTFDMETFKFNYFNYTEWEHEMMTKFYPHLHNLTAHFIHAGQVVKMIGFDEMEFIFLSALLIFNPDVADVERPDLIEKSQNLIMSMLEEYEKRTFGKWTLRFGMILLRLAEFNMFTVKHNQTMRLLVAEHPELEIPQLYKEMFGSKILHKACQS